MRMFTAAVAVFLLARPAAAQEAVSFPTQDGGVVHALVYGIGEHAVVLAHGGRFNKESWDRQSRALAAAGFRVLAFDFRGHGQSRGPTNVPQDYHARRNDVLAAVTYLRTTGAKIVSAIGASMGGDYVAEAAETDPEAIDRLVLLAAGAYTPLRRMTGPKLFIMSRDDVIGDSQPRLPAIRQQYERASGPKQFVVLEGSAHAQELFATPQSERLMLEILKFFSAR